MKLALASIALLTGCAQILGLEDTQLNFLDAPVDAPNVCDTPAFPCAATTGRALCGQLVTSGTATPFRVANPTAQVCASTEGPCGLTVFGQSLATYFAGGTLDRVTARVDDCGHFVVDMDPTATDVAIGIAGTDVVTSARLVLDLMAGASTEPGIAALVVPRTTSTGWATQLAIAESEIASGYLVRYVTTAGVAVPMEQVRVSGAPVGGPVARPWAAYFTGEFETFDPSLMATTALGTAFIAPPTTGTFRIGGFHIGRTCERAGLQSVTDTLLHVVLKGC